MVFKQEVRGRLGGDAFSLDIFLLCSMDPRHAYINMLLNFVKVLNVFLLFSRAVHALRTWGMLRLRGATGPVVWFEAGGIDYTYV